LPSPRPQSPLGKGGFSSFVSQLGADLIIQETAASVAPEICVEIFSNSNTVEEMEFKRNLYFQAGAGEVWTCDRLGIMSFYKPKKQLLNSELVPDFPQQIQRRKLG